MRTCHGVPSLTFTFLSCCTRPGASCVNRATAKLDIVLLRSTRGGNMFSLLGTAIFGLIVGALAKLVMPGRDPGGILVTMLIGIAGAVLGGFAGRAMGLYGTGE